MRGAGPGAAATRRGHRAVPSPSSHVIGMHGSNSVPGGRRSTIYWYEQLRRYAVQRSVATFALLVSSLLGIVTLVLLADPVSPSAATGSQLKAASRARGRGRDLIAAVLGRRQFVPAALWAVRHLGGRDAPRAGGRRQSLVSLLVLGFLNWLFERCSSLRCPRSSGPDDPSPRVVVAYTLGQLVSAIPILPGGGGTIEATMSAGSYCRPVQAPQ